MAFEKLFEPVKIGPVEIKNRIVMAPMLPHMSNSDGTLSEQELCYYAARARGGVGLIITGVFLSSRRAWEQQAMNAPALFDASVHLGGAGELAETIHSFGSKVFIQLSPGMGRQQTRWKTPLYSASAGIPFDTELARKNRNQENVPFLKVGPRVWTETDNSPLEMTAAEIRQEIADYLAAADLAIVAGFDGIEVHSPHGYLLHQFLSPRTNRRTDEYGGSLENRCRFLLEIISGLRREFGPCLPVCVRLSSADHVEGGITPEESREQARLCEKAGADVIHLSDGCQEASRYFFPPQENTHILEEQGHKLKKVVGIPVISFGIHDPDLAEKAVSEGQTDLISAGRAFMADPDWPNKLREGRLREIVRCQREHACQVAVMRGGGLRCIVNPNLGREKYMPEYWPQKRSLRIPETLARVRGISQTHIVSPSTGLSFRMVD